MSKPSPQVEMARVALLFITSPASAIAIAAIAALLQFSLVFPQTGLNGESLRFQQFSRRMVPILPIHSSTSSSSWRSMTWHEWMPYLFSWLDGWQEVSLSPSRSFPLPLPFKRSLFTAMVASWTRFAELIEKAWRSKLENSWKNIYTLQDRQKSHMCGLVLKG